MSLFRHALRPLYLVLAAVLALAVAPAASAQTLPPPSRTVVAVIDSMTNPYHEFFNAGGSLYGSSAPDSVTPAVLAEFGIDSDHIIHLTRTGNFDADFAQDKAQFDAIRVGEPYWFEGTNIIGISFNETSARLSPTATQPNASSHGVGTTSAVLTANPDAIVVLVQDSESGSLTEFGSSPVGENYAFNHPAVDFISTSYGPPGSPPLGYHLYDSYKGVVTNGKIHVGAADNSPALSPVDATSGPWWTVGVAGYGEGSGNAREYLSGTAPDFVGDFTQQLPYCLRCVEGKSNVSGTSFATPRTAGTLSKILLDLRTAAGHQGGIVKPLTGAPLMVSGGSLSASNWQIRRALEEAAYYPGGDNAQSWATFSWGAVTPDPQAGVITQALAHLGVGGPPTRTKSDGACQVMTANMTARFAWWTGSPRSQGFTQTAFPYIAC